MVIVDSGENRMRGLGDASISPMTIDHIANPQPFVEGDKRTSFELATRLLRIGGYELDDTEETFRFIKDVARGKYDREGIEDWLKCHSHVSNP